MDVANTLVAKIFSFVDLLKECADNLDKLANELEKNKKIVNATKVAGSAVSVGGGVAMLGAGVATVITGGAALPVIAAGGAIASWVGLATNVTTDVVDAIISSSTLKEAEEVSNKIKMLHEKMEKLVESLKEEVQRRADCGDEMEYILRAMAERNGLKLRDSVSLTTLMSYVFKDVMSVEELFHHTLVSIGLSVLSQAARGAGKLVAERMGGKAAGKVAGNVAGKAAGQAAGKAVGRVAGGAVALVFSVPELIENCKSLDCCETDASKNLRVKAKAIRAESKAMERELEKIGKTFRRLARVKHCIENPQRSRADKEFLIEFVKEHCKDQEVILEWLMENSVSEVLFQLVDLLNYIREKIDEEKKKRRSRKKSVRITFVAHGEIDSAYMIPASCLMPLPNITDVVLYSPWNCYITAEAAYGISTGLIGLKDRIFFCGDDECCGSGENHKPDFLPARWNSMKAEYLAIPNINVSPMNLPKDEAYMQFKFLEDKHGTPDPDCITILYLPPGPDDVPFYIITLIFNIVLFFCDYKATLHLAACLGEKSEDLTSAQELNINYLKLQYAYTKRHTAMTISSDKFPIRDPMLYCALKALFASTYSRR